MKRLGQILISAGKITPEQLENALNKQKKTARKLGDILIEEGYITESELAKTLSQKFHVPSVDIRTEDVDKKLVLQGRNRPQKNFKSDPARPLFSLFPRKLQSSLLRGRLFF